MTWIIDIIVTLAFFALLIYARLFRKVYEIDFSEEKFLDNIIAIKTLLVVNTVLALILLFLLYRQYQPKEDSILSLWIQVYFGWYFNALNRGLFKVYTFIFDLGAPNKVNYSKYVIHLAKWFIISKPFRISLYLGIIIPRVIIVCFLIFEIYFGFLKYFYYSLLLLIIPLIVQFIIFMLKDISPRLYPEFRKHVIITKEILPEKEQIIIDGITLNTAFNFHMHPDYPKDDFSDFMTNYYEPLLYIESKLNDIFLPIYTKIRLLTLFLYFSILAACWYYVLCIYF